uniref:Amino acid adenylation domain-containing protein n=1 Tax=Candidatus Kentrum sp. DK TaxID=2126562 RepID=A0A450S3F4_9GAMM|nr:MAG: amino acid adenylation domain-containing protein [Candidatus Kentron sp. DK]
MSSISSDQCVHEIFEEQVAKIPDAIAVVFPLSISGQEEEVSYGELNARANRLAHRLRKLGVGPEVLVGLFMERSMEMVVGLLAILKACGAYVPLDPDYPAERLAFMAEDADLKVLLCHGATRDRLPECAARILDVDGEAAVIAVESPDNPERVAAPDNLAYVIYTSGSTGKPKGVMVEHGMIANHILSIIDLYGLKDNDRVLQFASLSFDASLNQIFGPLLAGAAIVSRGAEIWTPEECLRNIVRHGVTVVHVTPLYGQQLLGIAIDHEEDLNASDFRLLNCGGEALPPATVGLWLKTSLYNGRLLNTYGPTEATVTATAFDVPTDWPEDTVSIPIGKPLPDRTVYILDPRMRPVPVGVDGELHIGGAGVARGYLNRPNLTAERFIPDPFSDNPGARLYRTGDLCRWLSDGNIEFLGRIDTQVKIRGFRVELGEIEAVIGRHPAIREVVVNLSEVDNDKQLTAYVICHSKLTLSNRTREANLPNDSISQLEHIYDDAYSQSDSVDDPTFNIGGWKDSYTGQLIPEEDIREWIQATVTRILAYRPKHVLEIGCGTGLLLFRLVPHCSRYCGADISSEGLRYIARKMKEVPEAVFWPPVSLYHQPAHDFTHIEAESFDTIIINSVISHFPNVEYLVAVLEKAVSLVSPDGVIFVGDVTNLLLREAMQASVQLYKSSPFLLRGHLHRRIRQHIVQEEKLFVDPRFFIALKQHLPGIGHVSIQLRRGTRHNEMTQFRYDAIIHVGSKSPTSEPFLELDWRKDQLDLDSVRDYLIDEQPGTLIVKYIPNVRIRTELMLLELITNEEGLATVAEIREILSTLPPTKEPDPEAFWRLADSLPYEVCLTPGFKEKGCYHAIFQRLDGSQSRPPKMIPIVEDTGDTESWSVYANNPQQWKIIRELAPKLRSFLRESLPNYMVPATFVVLSSFPLTPNGKVDRRALSASHPQRCLETTFVAPRTPTEEKLANIWADALGIEQIGIHDDFFELGGHSLKATQVISRIRQVFSRELSLRDLFESPTIAQLRDLVKSTDHKKQLPPITPVDRNISLPLSFAQQRLWFMNQLEGKDAIAYHDSWALLLEGTLRPNALERSLREIIQRHEILRTTFPTSDGNPTQVIHPLSKIDFELTRVDLRGLSHREQEQEERRLVRVEVQRFFDLVRGPLFRTMLISKSPDAHVLLITLHHIIFDGWSQAIFIKELSECYGAFSQDRLPSLLPLTIQYVDFSNWQRQWLSRERLQEQIDYWKQQLVGTPTLLMLSTDFPRPSAQRFHGASCPIRISAELTGQLQFLGDRTGTTLFMVLLSGFAIMLARYSRQTDIVIGVPIANRTHPRTESLIGFFVNTLVLRLDLSGEPSFEALLQQARRVALGAYEHQDLPFEQLVEEINPSRSLSHSPLFQVVLQLQDAPLSDSRLSELRISQLDLKSVNAKSDLALILEKTDQGIVGKLEYNTDLFKPSSMERFAAHFNNLLNAVVQDPSKPIHEFPLLTEVERKRILVDWNASEVSYPADQCVHEIFEEQVAKAPDAIAVVFPLSISGQEEKVSYGELNARANRLAHRLRKLGVGPEVLVGLFVERSVEMVVDFLAILKAGGAYVPLDPEYPQKRLAFMAEDADLGVLLCHGATRERLPECTARILDLDAEVAVIAGECSDNPARLVGPDNLAYVIYTSGSTGKPKGVMVEHGMIANHILSIIDLYGLKDNDRVLQFASLSFDASLNQILGPLLAGAAIVSRGAEIWTPEECLRNIVRHGVTVVHVTPLYGQQLLGIAIDHEEDLNASDFRLLNCGGEALPPATVGLWLKTSLYNGRLLNTYGPTEATVTATAFDVPTDWPEDTVSIPIGKPLPDRTVYILDPRMRPVPVGVDGELHIGGAGVARGYLNRPNLTAERFIPDPFSDNPGARLYRTGDLCRWLSDGNIEFLGRIDTQVKIRGFRVELGEVENALLTYPGIREAVVDARGEGMDKRLAAWVVVSDVADQPVSRDALRAHLRRMLPDWMVPSVFVFVNALSMTPSGKVDRQALPNPDAGEFGAGTAYVAPRGPAEDALCGIFVEVLGIKRVGVHDDFFELGGHSLLATRVVYLVRKRLGVELPLRALFEYSDPAGLARVVCEQKEWQPTILLPLKARGSKPPLFCIHPVGGGAFCYRELADCLPQDQPVYGIQAVGFEGKMDPLTNIDAMATRYVEQIMTVWPEGPCNLYGWSFGGVVSFEMARLLQMADREVKLLVLTDTFHPSCLEDRGKPKDVEIIAHLLAEAGEMEQILSNEIEGMAPDERLTFLRQWLMVGSNLAGFGDLDRFVRIYRTNLLAISTYRPSTWGGKMIFLSAQERPRTDDEPADIIWRRFARRIEHHVVPGNHFTMHRQPNVRRIAEILENALTSTHHTN